MSGLEFLDFAPVPVRARRDGWTAERQRAFVVALARGMGPAEAARSVGRSRQTAYALREKRGGEGFAAAWDAAVDFAAEIRAAPRHFGGALPAIDVVLVPRYYRGRLIGFVQREDVAGAMRRLGALDRLADRLPQLDPAAPSFEEALAALAKADEADAISHANAVTSSSSGRLRQRPPEGLG